MIRKKNLIGHDLLQENFISQFLNYKLSIFLQIIDFLFPTLGDKVLWGNEP